MSWARTGFSKCASLVAGAALLAVALTSSAQSSPPASSPQMPAGFVMPSLWFVITSDPQYPWTPYMDGYRTAPSPDEHAYSRQLIEKQYDSINRFAAGKRVAGTFINGDLTAFGHPHEIAYMRGAMARLQQPVYLGLGNHDYQNNVNDCFENQCLRGSVYWYISHMAGMALDSWDLSIRDYYNFPHNVQEIYGSLGWRKTFNGITVIQLNNHASYTTWGSGYSASLAKAEHINIRPAFRWLEDQLKWARERGQAIVLMMHKSEISEIEELAKKYEVDAIFAGHYHDRASCHFYASVNAPVCWSGSASLERYLVMEDVEEKGRELKIYRVRANDPETRELIYTVVPKRNAYGEPSNWLTSKYPFEVRVQNQGGYEAGFWASYWLNGQPHHMEAYRQLGTGHVFQFPAGARNARIHAAAYTGVLWHKWDDIFIREPSPFQDHCYKVWGTTFHNDSSNC